MRLYYWKPENLLGRLVCWATRGQWDHVAIGWTVEGVDCYIESIPLAGVRLVPVSVCPPDAYQETGVHWTPELARQALSLLGRRYDYLDGIRAAMGLKPRHRNLECAEVICTLLDLACPATPQGVAIEIQAATGNNVVSLSPSC